MVKLFKYTGLQFIFWLIFFALNRAVFLAYYSGIISLENISLSEVFRTFIAAFKLDVSMTCYLIIVSFVLFLFQYHIKKNRLFLKINSFVTYIIVVLYAFLTGGEMGVYEEWKTKLSSKALAYFNHPTEVFNSTSTSSFVLLLFIVIGIIICGVWSYNKWIKPKSFPYSNLSWKSAVYVIIILPLSVLGMRGGLQAIPITQSEAYFSKHNILNLAAVNNAYNIGMSLMETGTFMEHNPFESMPDAKANDIVKSLHHVETDTTTNILAVKKPNIVLVLLESWSGDLIESLGGKPGITPQFHELEKDGLLFTNHYASGNRSQQAMASVFSGFPALPITTLTNHPDKYHSLPSLVKDLNAEGYNTSFYFGGQLIYGNIKAYMVYNEFNRIVEGEDLDPKLPRGKLGVHDGLLFPEHVKDLSKEKELSSVESLL